MVLSQTSTPIDHECRLCSEVQKCRSFCPVWISYILILILIPKDGGQEFYGLCLSSIPMPRTTFFAPRGPRYFEIREKTLLLEYKNRHKNNVLLDKRIGEDARMDPERKMILRAIAQKKLEFSKKSIFNLNEDEILTHGGVPISESNVDDRAFFSDNDDDPTDQQGMLDGDFVKSHHFGGDLFVKHDENEKKDGQKSRKEIIDEIIAESKKKKADMQKDKEEQRDAVEKLDSKLKDFLKALSGRTINEEYKAESKKNCEFSDYDTIYRELMLDRSGKTRPTDRMKTAEELAREEAEKLKAYEARRKEKMNRKKIKDKGFSADALDHSYYNYNKFHHVDDVPENEESDANDEENIASDEESNADEEESDASGEESDVNDEEGDANDEENIASGEESDANDEESIASDEGSEENNIDEKSDIGVKENDRDVEKSDNSSNESDDNVEENDDEEFAEIESDEDTACKEREDNEGSKKEEMELSLAEENNKPKQPAKIVSSKKTSKKTARVSFSEDTITHQEKIPADPSVPSSYEGLWTLMLGRSPTHVSELIDTIISSNVQKLWANKKQLCNSLFSYLLQALNSICSGTSDKITKEFHPLLYIASIVPHLHTLVKISPAYSADAFSEIINKKFEEYSSKTVRSYPKLNTFVFLKVAGLLFPASDYHHQVMTPVMTFLTQMLAEVKPKTRRDISALLFTSFTLVGYLWKSRRFIGELVNALKGILYLSIPTSLEKLKLPHTAPFSRIGPKSVILVVGETLPDSVPLPSLTFTSLNAPETDLTDDFRAKALDESLKLLLRLCDLWGLAPSLPSMRAIFHPVRTLLKRLMPLEKYPQGTKDLAQKLQDALEDLPPAGRRLVKEHGRPQPQKTFDPKIEKVFDGEKKREGPKAALELQKLQHNVRRERKGVRRELRRDRTFLAQVQLREQLASDAERKRKVKQIMGELSLQQGEYNKLKKSKKF